MIQGHAFGMSMAKDVQEKNMMLIGLGLIGRLVSKLPDKCSREWYGYLDKHSDKEQDVIFLRWMDREGRRVVGQKVEQMSTQLVHGQAGVAGAGGAGAQRQLQGPQTEAPRRKYEGVQFPSTRLDSCEKFLDLNHESKAIILEEQSGCSLCTSFLCKRKRCYQRRRGQIIITCGVTEGNKVCGQEHLPMLHLSKSSYCLATTHQA